MEIISHNVESRLLEEVKSIKGQLSGNFAIHFHLYALQEVYRSELQQRIALNILNDVFRQNEGYLFKGNDGDLILLYKGEDEDLLDRAVLELRYLFEDDPLAYHAVGQENDKFSDIYDLSTDWRLFYRICAEREEFSGQVEVQPQRIHPKEDDGVITPAKLAEIIYDVNEIDFNLVVRKQPICAIKPDMTPKVVFHEIYVNIGHLGRIIKTECNLASDRWLFGFLCKELDRQMLDMISDRPKAYIDRPVSINLSISTIFTEEFKRFCDILHMVMKAPIVVEIQIEDVFYDINAFMAARDIIQQRGYRICLDGLTTKSFIQIDRADLGFDLAKVRWNADLVGDLDKAINKRYAKAIKKCGANRIILCRCDSEYAIEYGNALGISLFQGRYTDKVINPNGRIEN